MNTSIFKMLLYAALVFPAVASAQSDDCHCKVERVWINWFWSYIDESPGCDLPAEEMCGLTLGDGLLWRDLSDFEDFRGDTITIGSGTFPQFNGAALVNSQTFFKLEIDVPFKIIIDGLDVVDAVVGLLEGRVDAYNEMLAQCKGVCTLAFPNLSSAAPITLIEWEAEPARDHVTLEWLTADEKDNDYFLVSHSTDGVNFTTLATVSGQGTTEFSSSYRYEHRHPAAGANYYRLEQHDYDGTVSQLGVRHVTWSGDANTALTITPNPVASGQRLSVNGPVNENTEIVLIDPAGRRISDISLEGQSFLVPDLVPGMYTVLLNGEATRLVVAR